jgi:TonB family protein
MRLWPALLLASTALAQTPVQPTVYHVGDGITAPVLIYKTDPEYSAEARAARLEGVVTLALVVGADGRASEISVRKSAGMGLDQNAIAAVIGWRFKPAMKDAQRVAVESTVEVYFHLYSNSDWHLNGAIFRTEPGVSAPTIVRATYPDMTQDSRFATFRIAAQIDERGIPREVQVVYSSDPSLDDEVIRLIREWRFQAAQKAGQAVPVTAEFEFSHGVAPVPATPVPVRRKQL